MRRSGWYQISNTGDAARVYLYDEIGMWGITAAAFEAELRNVTAPVIELHVNSPGGSVFDGMAIYNALRSHKARKVCYVDSLAASAASFVAMAADRIIMRPRAQMMIHDAHGVCVGSTAEMANMAALLDKQSDNIAAVYQARCGGTVAEWRARMRSETWYMADEAVKAGLADAVEDYAPPADMTRNTWDLSIFTRAGRDHAPDPFDAPAEPAPDEPVEDAPTEEPVSDETWAALTAALTNPAPSTADAVLERLREGLLCHA
jgi:ATP-dependent protease ClpP protease subunit